MALPSRYTGQPIGAAQAQDSTTVTSGGLTSTTAANAGSQASSGSTSQFSSGTATTPEALQAMQLLLAAFSGNGGQAPIAIPQQYRGPNGAAMLQRDLRLNSPQPFQSYTPASGTTRGTVETTDIRKFNELKAIEAQLAAEANQAAGGSSASQDAISGAFGRMTGAAEARASEITRNQARAGEFTTDAAINQANDAAGYWARVLGEQALNPLAKAAEGAGTSQGSMRALLTQQALQRVNEQASQQRLGHIINTAGVGNAISGNLEALTKPTVDPIVQVLLNAMQTAKGTVENRSTVGSTQQTGSSYGETRQDQYTPPRSVTTTYAPPEELMSGFAPAPAQQQVAAAPSGGVIIRHPEDTMNERKRVLNAKEVSNMFDGYTNF